MKRLTTSLFAAALALATLAAQAVPSASPDADFLQGQLPPGYQEFFDAMSVMCGAPQPFLGQGPGWICTDEGRVDAGLVAVPHEVD